MAASEPEGDPEETDWGFARSDHLLPGTVASAVGYHAEDIEQQIHRGIPSPFLTFIITLDEPVIGGSTVEQALGPDATRAAVAAAGLSTRPTYIRQPSVQSGVQLALYPLAARSVFGMPAAELADSMEQGEAVIGRPVERLRDRLVEVPDWDARFALLRGFLADRIADQPPAVRPEVAEAWRWLVRHRGAGSVAGVADHVHLSQRQLHTLFDREFGLGPKAFNRLLRFQRALRMITERVTAGHDLDLAGVAGWCGYADQSHLNKDFRAMTGTSPTAWVAEEIGNIRAGGHRNGD